MWLAFCFSAGQNANKSGNPVHSRSGFGSDCDARNLNHPSLPSLLATSHHPVMTERSFTCNLSPVVLPRVSPLKMVDTLSPEDRSHRMSLVRGTDTKPEMFVRKLVHGMGYRYRLHQHNLPGTPDLVFKSRKAVIFVHGCFWHRHEGCPQARIPKSRVDFWTKKLEGNRLRDEQKLSMLRTARWRVLIVWECELKNKEALAKKLRLFLDEERHNEMC